MKKLLVLNILLALLLEFCVKFFFTKQFTDEGILIWNLIPYWLIILFSVFIGLFGYFSYSVLKNKLRCKDNYVSLNKKRWKYLKEKI